MSKTRNTSVLVPDKKTTHSSSAPPCTNHAHVDNLHGHRSPLARLRATRCSARHRYERRTLEVRRGYRQTRRIQRGLQVHLTEGAGPRKRRSNKGVSRVGNSGKQCAQGETTCDSHGVRHRSCKTARTMERNTRIRHPKQNPLLNLVKHSFDAGSGVVCSCSGLACGWPVAVSLVVPTSRVPPISVRTSVEVCTKREREYTF